MPYKGLWEEAIEDYTEKVEDEHICGISKLDYCMYLYDCDFVGLRLLGRLAVPHAFP